MPICCIPGLNQIATVALSTIRPQCWQGRLNRPNAIAFGSDASLHTVSNRKIKMEHNNLQLAYEIFGAKKVVGVLAQLEL